MSKLINVTDADGDVCFRDIFKQYSLTRTTNNYANATATGRLALYRMVGSRMGILYFNFMPSTTIPANTSDFEIGKFDCTLINSFYQTVPSQAGLNCNLFVQVTAAGALRVGNYSSVASGTSWYRAMIPVMFAGSSV